MVGQDVFSIFLTFQPIRQQNGPTISVYDISPSPSGMSGGNVRFPKNIRGVNRAYTQ